MIFSTFLVIRCHFSKCPTRSYEMLQCVRVNSLSGAQPFEMGDLRLKWCNDNPRNEIMTERPPCQMHNRCAIPATRAREQRSQLVERGTNQCVDWRNQEFSLCEIPHENPFHIIGFWWGESFFNLGYELFEKIHYWNIVYMSYFEQCDCLMQEHHSARNTYSKHLIVRVLIEYWKWIDRAGSTFRYH